MIDKNSILQILGSLMKHPQFLSETDKYMLTPIDFRTRFDKYLFIAIEGLYKNGATSISAIDIDNYFDTNESAKLTFEKNNGIEYLQDAEYVSDVSNFPYYYKRLKKFNLLDDLKKQGIDTTQFYNENLTDPNAVDINQNFEKLEISDILGEIKKRVLQVESTFLRNDVSESQTAYCGMEELLEDLGNGSDIGKPIQGAILNEVVAGARKGTFYIRSGSSGVSKTRQAVGDACYLAYPFRYDDTVDSWVQEGYNEKVLVIATEQDFKEIRKMILAYLTGMNESKFRYGQFSEKEKLIIKQALWVMKEYESNFIIVRMPNPTIELVKNIVRENCLTKNIEYVFYDYVFISPSLLSEFKGVALRNDEILLMFSTALKELAVELGIFVMTSTQVNANADDNKNIRNEGSIAGSRAVINKADVGMIMARPTKEELDILKDIIAINGLIPNIVTDIYKVRSGQYNQVRIWSSVDLGNLRKKDLFMTDSRLDVVNYDMSPVVENWEDEEKRTLQTKLKELSEVA